MNRASFYFLALILLYQWVIPNSVLANDVISGAFEQQLSGIQVKGAGIVIKLLPDDTKGSMHQRFILELQPGQTILIAHNIDLAERINSLSIGDEVEFYGQYEWNNKGGVVHWTHEDPSGNHIGGWLKHNGRIYQ